MKFNVLLHFFEIRYLRSVLVVLNGVIYSVHMVVDKMSAEYALIPDKVNVLPFFVLYVFRVCFPPYIRHTVDRSFCCLYDRIVNGCLTNISARNGVFFSSHNVLLRDIRPYFPY